MSDPSQGLTKYMGGSFKRSMKKSHSETGGVDVGIADDGTEVEAGTLQDGTGIGFSLHL